MIAAPPSRARPISPSDTADIPETMALWVEALGHRRHHKRPLLRTHRLWRKPHPRELAAWVHVVLADGQPAHLHVPEGVLPLRVTRVLRTGTRVRRIVALW